MLKPLIISILATLAWGLKRFYINGFLNITDDIETFTQSVIPTIGIFHAIFASAATMEVIKEYKEAQEIIFKFHEIDNDEITEKKLYVDFLFKVQLRMNKSFKVFLIALSVLLESSFFLIAFKSNIIGSFSIFSITFILMAFYQIIEDLDNPLEGVFNVDIPEAWLTELKKRKQIK